jgi:pimeloyl-ACP methyl ester carboxylesterase
VHGQFGASKTPLLLIPGAFMATGSMREWADAFARERAVSVFDQQGHGRTPRTPRGRCRTNSSLTMRRHYCAL